MMSYTNLHTRLGRKCFCAAEFDEQFNKYVPVIDFNSFISSSLGTSHVEGAHCIVHLVTWWRASHGTRQQ